MTHHIHLASTKEIHIAENRQRKTFAPTELNELAESIQLHGLIHPLVVREESGRLVLVAGERRLRAITDIYDLGGHIRFGRDWVPDGDVPYVLLGELSPLAAKAIELEENIRRVDLSWQEKAAATAELLALRTAQAEAGGAPPPSIADIAEEVRGSSEGSYHDATKKEVILAAHLDDPEVAAARTLDDAFKVLKRREETQRNLDLAAAVGDSFRDKHTLVHGDAVEWMQYAEPNQFAVIITDPPYGMGADEFGDSGGATPGAHFYDDSRESALRLYEVLAVEGYRITLPHAHAYVFCDIDNFSDLRAMFTSAGWKVFRTPLIWHKPAAYRAPWPEHGPQRKYECILYAMKGDRRVLKLAPDVITCPPDENLGHPAQKPVNLYNDLLSRSVRPGDKVLDPFSGTGPVFPAADSLQAIAYGVEKDSSAYGLAVKRLQALREVAP